MDTKLEYSGDGKELLMLREVGFNKLDKGFAGDNREMIRIYPNAPGAITIQMRTNTGGRNVMTTASYVGREEIETIIKHLRKLTRRMR